MASSTTVVASFENRQQAEAAIQALRQAGYAETEIGLLSPDDKHSGLPNDPTHSHWEEGAGVGAAAGALTGAGLGLAVAAGLMPPIGPAIAGGTLIALLASAGGGASVGTVLGALVGLGLPEEEAAYHEQAFHSGRTLVTVEGAGRQQETVETLRRLGADLHAPQPAR